LQLGGPGIRLMNTYAFAAAFSTLRLLGRSWLFASSLPFASFPNPCSSAASSTSRISVTKTKRICSRSSLGRSSSKSCSFFLGRMTVRMPDVSIPVQFLPPLTFSATKQITPTGVKTYPATTAHGNLTITNGSVVSQELPQGLIFTSKEGGEVETDTSVFVPAGSAAGFGDARVSAHPVMSGAKANLSPLSIDAVYGTSLYIRNLEPFTGG